MQAIETSDGRPDGKPLAVRIGLWLALGLLCGSAAYLYAVRGNAIILDLANGLAGMFCM
jgi:hypothetical protein